jgi:hypothetical protein
MPQIFLNISPADVGNKKFAIRLSVTQEHTRIHKTPQNSKNERCQTILLGQFADFAHQQRRPNHGTPYFKHQVVCIALTIGTLHYHFKHVPDSAKYFVQGQTACDAACHPHAKMTVREPKISLLYSDLVL